MNIIEKINVGGAEYSLPIKTGSYDSSAIINIAGDNQALAEHSFASGKETIAGCMGYYIAAVVPGEQESSEGHIYLSKTAVKPTWDEPKSVDESFESGYEKLADTDENGYETYNNEFSISADGYDQWPFAGKITDIDGNCITYNSNTLNSSDKWLNLKGEYDDNTAQPYFIFYVPKQPLKGTVSVGVASVAEGWRTHAAAQHSHAEGYAAVAGGRYGHAEGNSTRAGYAAHAEGNGSEALGHTSHAEGGSTIAQGQKSHAEGTSTQAIGNSSHAEGRETIAKGQASHTEGKETIAMSVNSHAEGFRTKTNGGSSHAEGGYTVTMGSYAHAEGESDLTFDTSQIKANSTVADVRALWTGKNNELSTLAYGQGSHAEGHGTWALGAYAHAENHVTIAQGDYSHAEGGKTQAIGKGSHAEGSYTIADGWYQHVQGMYNDNSGESEVNKNHPAYNKDNLATGKYAHIVGNGKKNAPSNAYTLDWEGNGWFAGDITAKSFNGNATSAKQLQNSRAIIIDLTNTKAANFDGTLNIEPGVKGILPIQHGGTGNNTGYITTGRLANSTAGKNSTAEGTETIASGESSHAEGGVWITDKGISHYTTASGANSHAEGWGTEALGAYSHAEGKDTHATNSGAHAEGSGTTASGGKAHAEGLSTTASGSNSHAEGQNTSASSWCSHAEGYGTLASARFSHTGGYGTVTKSYASMSIGTYNQPIIGQVDTYNAKGDAFIVGNGTLPTDRKNAFRVNFSGNVFAANTSMSTGADYAEYFEWSDGNTNNEDRIGRFVTLDNGNQIRLANSGDEIIGVISGHASVIGDAYEDSWNGMYDRDIYGRLQYEDVEVTYEEEDEEGNIITNTVVETHIKLNPNYDPTQEYIPRSERPEWDAVGLMGKLVVIDDGSCVVGGKCTCGILGTATAADTGYHVLKRLDETHIQILLK